MERSEVAPATPRGWGVAGFIVLLAVVCVAAAAYIHKETYYDPRNPLGGVSTHAPAGH